MNGERKPEKLQKKHFGEIFGNLVRHSFLKCLKPISFSLDDGQWVKTFALTTNIHSEIKMKMG